MFSLLNADTHTVYESNVCLDDMEEKYTDKYMIASNMQLIDSQLYGNIIAVLTPSEYAEFKKKHPESILPDYCIVVGLSIKAGGLGVYGIYL
jgi:hypothetical protein